MDSARIYDKVNLVSSKNGYIMPRIKWSIKTIGLQFGNLGPFGSLLSLIPQGKHVAYVTLYHLTSVSRLSTTLGEFRRVLFGQMRSKCIIKKKSPKNYQLARDFTARPAYNSISQEVGTNSKCIASGYDWQQKICNFKSVRLERFMGHVERLD